MNADLARIAEVVATGAAAGAVQCHGCGGGIKLDRRLDLPAERNDELRMDPRLGREMQALLGAMEEE